MTSQPPPSYGASYMGPSYGSPQSPPHWYHQGYSQPGFPPHEFRPPGFPSHGSPPPAFAPYFTPQPQAAYPIQYTNYPGNVNPTQNTNFSQNTAPPEGRSEQRATFRKVERKGDDNLFGGSTERPVEVDDYKSEGSRNVEGSFSVAALQTWTTRPAKVGESSASSIPEKRTSK
ncbi:uncharacterized protein F4822DRAFT_393979 [Hypoxylon trugodes]|uniref:uncharacterized protein n=1 Tax=Hypoxylon trugodes TaxID=326681 RepID=UPI00219890B1|nr:uncharacterized protein F4822DRAFT_393979 [Hypoxylon trugodes]KAI1390659.1 hypothetical protein F4822DRAFT_393979 [Hypoxylon trugodes]